MLPEVKTTTFGEALKIRRAIIDAFRTGSPFEGKIPLASAACILGIPQDVLSEKFSMLLTDAGQNLLLVAAGTDKKSIALEALRSWQEEESGKSGSFASAAYRAVYGLVQAARLGAGKQAAEKRFGFLS